MKFACAPLLRIFPAILFCLALTGSTNVDASSGPVIGWGYDADDQATPPDAVNGVSGTAMGIAAGYVHSCAIQAITGESSGNVVCWGSDVFQGSYIGHVTPPDAVNGVSGTATDISAYYLHSCAIQAITGESSGNVVCWGFNSSGQATPPTPSTALLEPQPT